MVFGTSPTIIGVQQVNQFVSVARRKLRRSWPEVIQAVEDLQFFCPDPIPIASALHQSAIHLSPRYEYTIYDSLVVAAALEAPALSCTPEDMHNEPTIETLTIRKRF